MYLFYKWEPGLYELPKSFDKRNWHIKKQCLSIVQSAFSISFGFKYFCAEISRQIDHDKNYGNLK